MKNIKNIFALAMIFSINAFLQAVHCPLTTVIGAKALSRSVEDLCNSVPSIFLTLAFNKDQSSSLGAVSAFFTNGAAFVDGVISTTANSANVSELVNWGLTTGSDANGIAITTAPDLTTVYVSGLKKVNSDFNYAGSGSSPVRFFFTDLGTLDTGVALNGTEADLFVMSNATLANNTVVSDSNVAFLKNVNITGSCFSAKSVILGGLNGTTTTTLNCADISSNTGSVQLNGKILTKTNQSVITSSTDIKLGYFYGDASLLNITANADVDIQTVGASKLRAVQAGGNINIVNTKNTGPVTLNSAIADGDIIIQNIAQNSKSTVVTVILGNGVDTIKANRIYAQGASAKSPIKVDLQNIAVYSSSYGSEAATLIQGENATFINVNPVNVIEENSCEIMPG